jgi:4-hydroxy-tetrahydrodipicolinate reductase
MADITKVIVSGLPGKMATAAAERIRIQEDMLLIGESLTGDIPANCASIKLLEKSEKGVYGPKTTMMCVDLIKPNQHDSYLEKISEEKIIIVDYSQPDAVNRNAELYCKHKIPFVMGTTGGDRKKLEEVVKNSEISAVIAPNMAKQIVGFQAMMQYASENFPDLFKDYSLEIVESHQEGKKDTSGTAKAMVSYFNKLGISFQTEQIKMIRNPIDQKIAVGIPEEYLSGHGWHTYTLKSKEETVKFQFTHNVNGRDIYAFGTIDAIRFLNEKFYRENQKGKVYSMIDVLKNNNN